MQDLKITPRPWEVMDAINAIVAPSAKKINGGDGGDVIAFSPGSGDEKSYPKWKYNKKLIAAAPDLLNAAALAYVALNQEISNPAIETAMQALIKAIEKATK